MDLKDKIHHLTVAPAHSLRLQVPRALLVSVLATLVDVGLYTLLVKSAGLPPAGVAVVTYLIGGVVQYTLSTLWVFAQAPANHFTGFALFSLLSLVGIGITSGTIYLLYNRLGIDPILAKGAALVPTFCWNFFSRKYIIFRERAQADLSQPAPLSDTH